MIARRRQGLRPTLVPLIDVLFIMLIYFMVTSVYRDLNMIPVVAGAEEPSTFSTGTMGETVLIRISSEGQAVLRGQALTPEVLETARATGARVLLLPSPEAPLSALVTVLDRLRDARLSDVELVRLEPRP